MIVFKLKVDLLEEIRKKYKTVTKFALKSGIGRNTIYSIAREEYKNIEASTMFTIAHFLEMSVYDIWEITYRR